MNKLHIHHLLRRRLLISKGLVNPSALEFDSLVNSEWSEAFENLMRSRLLMGALRYGKLRTYGKPQYDRMKSIKKRIKLYNETHNTEYLVDIANLCLVEFVEGDHPKKHFSALDDTTEHVTIKTKSK